MFFSSSARHRPGDRSVSSLGVHIRPAITSLTFPCTAGKAAASKNNRSLTAGIRQFYSAGVAIN